ncbi:copper amine oxidase N-terminal domain-containing protein [Paenibacillus sp. YPG26]|uniref:copper amine oxidase N-terminal domain-containing protein n=1 Tax=Paenibacillus sp. YPG26 TaxID=2878915 RepID=UPI00203B8B78|nr:copper amine oxidase N-terminal domain-containing protein [Paenibacillus sp. YPG26]USB32260.1 copper amine oxidase N-terminal domain-containing protein [Paenibacillus sp. YPG26]
MKKWVPAAIAAVLLTGTMTLGNSAEAKTSDKIKEQVFINGVMQSEALVEKGRALIPLRSLNDPNWLTYNYDAKTHTVTAKSKNGSKVIKLKAGSKTATVNGEQVSLDLSVVNKEGRTYVPLRFVSEALGGTAYYNAKDKRAIVRTPAGQAAFNTLMKGDLVDARKEALKLIAVEGPDDWTPHGEGFSTTYQFPEGQALQYSQTYRLLTNYIKINQDGIAEVIGQLDEMGNKTKSRGIKPDYKGGYVYFSDNLMAELLTYGKVDSSGSDTELGRFDYIQHPEFREYRYSFILPIEGETRKDAK